MKMNTVNGVIRAVGYRLYQGAIRFTIITQVKIASIRGVSFTLIRKIETFPEPILI
jgi:hypothetical protein